MKTVLARRALPVLLGCSLGLTACPRDPSHQDSDTPVDSDSTVDTDGHTGDSGAAPAAPFSVDLLIAVDNSPGMADKHDIFVAGVPDLLDTFLNPTCVDEDGVATPTQPSAPSEPCPEGSQRLFLPVTDMHVGVISTSLGGHGSDACDGTGHPSEDDRAHLLDRADPDGVGTVPTYQGKHFLAWDSEQRMSPPGESDAAELSTSLQAILSGVGEQGCEYEAALESWYRFLVDPDPFESITVEGSVASPAGTDETLLAQRADFLRSDSILVIVMLGDENDGSTIDGGQYYFANQLFVPGTTTPYHLPRPQITCQTDPTSPCCRSCGQAAADGCPPKGPECDGVLPALDDHHDVRAWEQKRRFGIDFLWPIERYRVGLAEAQVADRDGTLVPNPLFADPGGRDASMVRLVGVVGVPWQDIVRQDGSNQPDPVSGLDDEGHPVGGLRSAFELESNDVWPIILGDPAEWVDAADPLMVESQAPRTGANPITGDALAEPGCDALANPINGHEYTIPLRDDLQYACIFPLPEPRDCSTPSPGCDCSEPGSDSPLCQDPTDDSFGQVQHFSEAYPARRQLQLLEALGDGAVVGSICPVQLVTPVQVDFGHTLVFDALARSLAGAGQE